jgi:hypothetical protein
MKPMRFAMFVSPHEAQPRQNPNVGPRQPTVKVRASVVREFREAMSAALGIVEIAAR